MKPVKRKANKHIDVSSEEEGPDSDVEMIDIDFDFFSPTAIDYHAIKLLLQQLLSHDSINLDLGSITDLILNQSEIGSVVKTDGEEGDPYAVLSVINCTTHRNHAGVKSLLDYIKLKSVNNSIITNILTQSDNNKVTIGLVLSERLVNMPPQIAQPMFKLLQDELEIANSTNLPKPYPFTHLLFLSRVFIASDDEEADPNAFITAQQPIIESESNVGGTGEKKKKKKKSKNGGGTLGVPIEMPKQELDEMISYHPEDEFISSLALATETFKYTESPNVDVNGRAKDSFGVETKGQLILLEAKHLNKIVEGLEKFFLGN